MEFIATFKLNITPAELGKLEYYRIHYLFKEYEAHVERENKEYEKQKGDSEKKNSMSFQQPSNPFGNFKPPSMPSMPSFNMPKL